MRSPAPLSGRCGADAESEPAGVPVFDLMAARAAERYRCNQSSGARLLRFTGRLAAGSEYHALCHAVSLGPAAGAAGSGRMGKSGLGELVCGLRATDGRTAWRPRHALDHA